MKMLKYTGLLIDLDDTILKSYKRYRPTLEYTTDIVAKRFGIEVKELLDTVLKTRRDLRLLMPNLPLGHNRLVAFRSALDQRDVKYRLDQLG